jgi:hypothetical protein
LYRRTVAPTGWRRAPLGYRDGDEALDFRTMRPRKYFLALGERSRVRAKD